MNIRESILAALTYATLALTASSANALVIYDWTGAVTSGSSSTVATAVLELNDTYVPGAALSNSDFVSFSYFASGCPTSCDIPFGGIVLSSLTGQLPLVSGNSVADVVLTTPDANTFFNSTAAGSWQFAYNPASGQNHNGDAGVWHLRVPEPGTLALFGLGLAGLGFARQRKAAS